MTRPSTRVLLVRHGATVLSAEDRFAGETDVSLSDEGRGQARRLAARIACEELAACYASPLVRTIETASILALPHQLEVQARPGLREISHGRWEGRTRDEVARLFAGEYASWEDDPFCFAPEGGETGLQVTARALPELHAIVAAHTGSTVLVVSHKATLRLLLCAVLGIDPRQYRDRFEQSPAALNILEFRSPTRARLTLFNDAAHTRNEGSPLPGPPAGRLSPWFR